MNTIEEVVAASTVPEAERAVLVASLVERENQVADALRSAGMQFGLYPEIVAEVLAEVGVGTPLSADERLYIRGQFIALMERLRNPPD